MNAFSPEWLKLREPADARARNRDIAAAVSGWFALRNSISVVDLGSGTGANVRATAPLLPAVQRWTLIEADADLLKTARVELCAWADAVSDDSTDAEGGRLELTKGSASLVVEMKIEDLAKNPSAAFQNPADLITASALFDLVSPAFISAMARGLSERRAALYAVLTFNGLERWSPHRPADNQVTAAFLRHQLTDKGFGPAAGALAAGHLTDQLRLNGLTVLEGESPWALDGLDRQLIEELVSNHAHVALESRAVEASVIASWVKVKRTSAVIGHTDIFATPGR